MPVEAWTTTLVILSFILYLYIGWRSRERESNGFFVADQGVPSLANIVNSYFPPTLTIPHYPLPD